MVSMPDDDYERFHLLPAEEVVLVAALKMDLEIAVTSHRVILRDTQTDERWTPSAPEIAKVLLGHRLAFGDGAAPSPVVRVFLHEPTDQEADVEGDLVLLTPNQEIAARLVEAIESLIRRAS